ncbi:hypothetical protein ABID52_002007 [Fictibacillus halophilus]|uniref:Uncharacterized protein n=1 Tax=Fictibacillus halophilus TaxID=1610490 RepID=A0ABV2LIL0_9BACL|nr:hypothetical protein [Fictibacillus halophilus]
MSKSKSYKITLTIFWIFSMINLASFLSNRQWLPFSKWIDALYSPLYKLMFGG